MKINGGKPQYKNVPKERPRMKTQRRIALVTGGNRGIGFAVCRKLAKEGFEVILAARSIEKARGACAKLQREGLAAIPLKLDVTSDTDVTDAPQTVSSRYGRLDILVNNAGVLLDPPRHPADAEGASVFNASLDVVRASLETNTFGALRLCQKFVPLMRKHDFGRIANISSGMGQLEEMNGGWPGYRLSKVALNALTRILADAHSGRGSRPDRLGGDAARRRTERQVLQGLQGDRMVRFFVARKSTVYLKK